MFPGTWGVREGGGVVSTWREASEITCLLWRAFGWWLLGWSGVGGSRRSSSSLTNQLWLARHNPAYPSFLSFFFLFFWPFRSHYYWKTSRAFNTSLTPTKKLHFRRTVNMSSPISSCFLSFKMHWLLYLFCTTGVFFCFSLNVVKSVSQKWECRVLTLLLPVWKLLEWRRGKALTDLLSTSRRQMLQGERLGQTWLMVSGRPPVRWRCWSSIFILLWGDGEDVPSARRPWATPLCEPGDITQVPLQHWNESKWILDSQQCCTINAKL